MATTARSAGRRTDIRHVDAFERFLSVGAALLLLAVLAALARGQAQWHLIGPMIWGHIATIAVALALTPIMLLRPRGDRLHRRLGYVWVAAMAGTALLSFGIRQTHHGGFSVIHLLSVWTLIQVPLIVWTARTHQHARHRGAVRGMVFGALLIAGFFTFPFGRLLGSWLFG